MFKQKNKHTSAVFAITHPQQSTAMKLFVTELLCIRCKSQVLYGQQTAFISILLGIMSRFITIAYHKHHVCHQIIIMLI